VPKYSLSIRIVLECHTVGYIGQPINFYHGLNCVFSALVLNLVGLFFVWMSICNMQFGEIADVCPIMESNFIWLYHLI